MKLHEWGLWKAKTRVILDGQEFSWPSSKITGETSSPEEKSAIVDSTPVIDDKTPGQEHFVNRHYNRFSKRFTG
jgi:hypothetical protein